MPSNRALSIIGLTIPVAALIAVALVLLTGSGRRTAANVFEPGLDLSIGVGNQCDSGGTPTATCTFPLNSTFTMDFKLNSPGPSLAASGWEGYDMLLEPHNLTPIVNSLVQRAPDLWGGCTFPGSDFSDPNKIAAGCGFGIDAPPEREYIGVLLHLDFQCGSTDTVGTLTLIPQSPTGGSTGLNLTLKSHQEAASETLTVNCGHPPTPPPTATRTPGGATDTPTASPTSTPTPAATNTPLHTPTPTVTPTRTPRPNHILLGDVDGDLTVDSLDALWVLWFAAGIVVDVPLPDAADMDGDDVVNATDALYILWVEAGEVTML
jgi:hypothetical protein